MSTIGGADNTLFVATGIRWGSQPYSRLHKLRAFDMDTGELLWSISGIYFVTAIADSYLVARAQPHPI